MFSMLNLPPLTGEKKLFKEAEQVRQDFIKKIDDHIHDLYDYIEVDTDMNNRLEYCIEMLQYANARYRFFEKFTDARKLIALKDIHIYTIWKEFGQEKK